MSASETPRSARRAVRLVSRREFRERIRDRGFQISTGITLLILVGLIVANSFTKPGATYALGMQSSPDVIRTIGNEVSAAGDEQSIHVGISSFSSRADGERLLRNGTIDAAIVQGAHGPEILVKSSAPDQLVGLVQVVARTALARAALSREGVSASHLDHALGQRPLAVRSLEPPDPHAKSNSAVAFVGVLLLYGQLFGYGFWVATGVVEEKSSRVVELLLSAIRPSELLTGKILGIGLLGLLQLTVMAVIALFVSNAVGLLTFPAGALGAAGLVIIWFALGFALYSTLFAVAGSLVSRQEDLQNTMTPISLVILASFFISIGALTSPDAPLVRIASFLPPSAPLAMPPRLLLGSATPAEGVLSAAISIAATVVMIRVASRIYAAAILRTGRTGLRDAWRSRRTSLRAGSSSSSAEGTPP
ncbi:MAG: ABC transporter permease [Actinomycetota bacterium]